MNLEKDKTEYIVAFVSEFAKKYKLSEKEAFNYLDRFSETYEKLINPKTGLYFQSPLYVYDFLKNEVLTGRMS